MTGQSGGLAGAQVPHQLSLVTGLHTGDVPLTVSWDEQEPPLDDAWTDAVEVSVELVGTSLSIETFEDSYEALVPAETLVRDGSAIAAYWHRVARGEN